MDTLYLSIDQNVEVHTRSVTLKSIAKLTCADSDVVNRLYSMKIVSIRKEKFERYIVSVLAIIKKIHEIYPNIEVNNIGEPQFVLTYRPLKQNVFWEWSKTILVCIILFFGAAFTIMTFNNDVGVSEVFDQLYKIITGHKSDGFTILEITYSIGIAAGILIFFNHFVGRRMSTDPTPIEVELRLYEENVNKTLIESCTRREEEIDVD